MDENYNDHCIINFRSRYWCIIGAKPGQLEVLTRIDDNTIMTAHIDTTKVDWNAYCQHAVMLLHHQWGLILD